MDGTAVVAGTESEFTSLLPPLYRHPPLDRKFRVARRDGTGHHRYERHVRRAEKKPDSRGNRCRRCFQTQRSRSEEHTSELQSLMRISYAVFCLKKKTKNEYRRRQHRQKKKQIESI